MFEGVVDSLKWNLISFGGNVQMPDANIIQAKDDITFVIKRHTDPGAFAILCGSQ